MDAAASAESRALERISQNTRMANAWCVSVRVCLRARCTAIAVSRKAMCRHGDAANGTQHG